MASALLTLAALLTLSAWVKASDPRSSLALAFGLTFLVAVTLSGQGLDLTAIAILTLHASSFLLLFFFTFSPSGGSSSQARRGGGVLAPLACILLSTHLTPPSSYSWVDLGGWVSTGGSKANLLMHTLLTRVFFRENLLINFLLLISLVAAGVILRPARPLGRPSTPSKPKRLYRRSTSYRRA